MMPETAEWITHCFQVSGFSLGIAFIGKAHKHPYHVIFVQKPCAGPDAVSMML